MLDKAAAGASSSIQQAFAEICIAMRGHGRDGRDGQHGSLAADAISDGVEAT